MYKDIDAGLQRRRRLNSTLNKKYETLEVTKAAAKSLETTGCEGPIRRCKIRHGARLPYKYIVI
jgi:hypothetical protein